MDIYTNWEYTSNKIVDEQLTDWKQMIDVVTMLEHLHEDLGKKYLKMLENEKIDVKTIASYNDKYGVPRLFKFNDNLECSPSTLRYISHANDICKLIKSKGLSSVNIIEIGGGYGGLCLILNVMSKSMNISINKYYIYDLPYVQKLQRYYLGNFDFLNNIEWMDNNTFGEGLKCENEGLKNILVSNYCLSEIDVEIRKKYLKNLLPDIDGAYMIWNSESKEGLPFIINEEDEDPQTGSINKKIFF